MKSPPLLQSMAFTAVLGAVVFLTMTAPSCNPGETTAQRTRAGRKNVFTAVAGAVTEDSAAGHAAARERAHSEALAVAKKAADAHTAQRDFLLRAGAWPPEKAATLAGIVSLYSRAWNALPEALISYKEEDSTAFLGIALPEICRRCDLLRADVAQLLPSAKKEWDTWEARNWEGYTPYKHQEPLPGNDAAEPGASPDYGRVFALRQIARIDSVIEESEYDADAFRHAVAPLRPGGVVNMPTFQPAVALPDISGSAAPYDIHWENLGLKIEADPDAVTPLSPDSGPADSR